MSIILPPVVGRERAILNALIDLSDSLVSDYDPLDFLFRVLDHGIPLTDAIAGAAFLHYGGSLHLVASSDENAEGVGIFEVQNTQGPAYDAFTTGAIVSFETLEHAITTWPEFGSAIAHHEWSHGYAVPMRLREHVVGAVVLFWAESPAARPSLDDEMIVKSFADVATIAVLQRREVSKVIAVNEQLNVALESRMKIEQAKGMVSQARQVPMGDAFAAIRQHARSNEVQLTVVARQIIDGELAIDALPGI